MQIEVYEMNPTEPGVTITLTAVCDSFSSLLWDVQYYGCGNFEVYIAANARNLGIFRTGRIVGRDDDKQHYGIIESVTLETDAENGDYLTITGRFLMSLLSRRIIYPTLSFSALTSYGDMVRLAVYRNCMKSDNRMIPGLRHGNTSGDCWNQKSRLQVSYENLMEWIFKVCEMIGGTANIRLQETSAGSGIYTMMLDLSQGTDRSILQEDNAHIVFSDSYCNLLTFGYSMDLSTQKNVAYVLGCGEGAERKQVLCYQGDEPASLDRYEVFVDAKDVSDETQENGVTAPIPEEDYLGLLMEKGAENLVPITEISESTIAANNRQYQYNRDYFVGDYVTVEHEHFGLIQPKIQLVGMIESYDQNGRTLTPTFKECDFMGFSYGFFNAKNMDRTYTAEDFTGYLSSIICNGVFDTYGDCFSVSAGNGTSVVIGTGKAWIDGHYFINDTAYTLDLTKYVDESLSRYIIIGINCDVSENVRACKLEVKSGTAATTPAIPVFEDTASKKFLTLAAVYLKGGTKSITSSNIRDMRENEEKCGYVKCVLGKCRVSEMLVAMAFVTDKMNEMVGKIDSLQSTVDTLQLKVDDLTGDIVATGPLGADIYYVLYSNGKVLVRGTGAMYDYDLNDNVSPLRGNNDIKFVVISEGITSVGENIFENCQNMRKITLPTTLKTIGDSAFMQGDGYVNTVYGLTEITIPSGVTSIGASVFWGSAIGSLVIPESVTEIGKYACRDCSALKSVTINGTVIGEFMFVSCTKLSTFNIGSKLKKIGSNVFNYCAALETITYDETLAKWQAIEKGSNWDGRSAMETAQSGLVKIQCTDGYMEYADGAWKEVKE